MTGNRTAAVAVLLATAFGVLEPAAAQTPRPLRGRAAQQQAEGPREYRSKNFVVYTDLSEEKAEDLLKRLETMLGIISKYWGQANREPIECYVVEDLSKWPAGVLSEGGLQSIRDQAGVTETMTVRSGLTGQVKAAKSVVYAIADRGTPQHEAVHAYCGQNFGRTGPTWYSEGMAEMGNYWRVGETDVQLPEPVLRYLQESDPKPLLAIVDNTDQTGDSWQNYAWRWALCHLLAYNPNYAPRFRPLGLNLLLDKPDSFERTYGASAREIEFEYHFFLNHLENGFRADLAAWDWKASYRLPTRGRTFAATVEANRGWQPSRLKVEAGKSYKIAATGTWKVAKDGPDLTADGTDGDRGRLVGAVFDPTTYTLGESFPLGQDLTFTAPAEGNLVLRCSDGWGELHDNSGKLAVKLSPAE